MEERTDRKGIGNKPQLRYRLPDGSLVALFHAHAASFSDLSIFPTIRLLTNPPIADILLYASQGKLFVAG